MEAATERGELFSPHLPGTATLLRAANLMISSRCYEIFIVDPDMEPIGVVREVDVVRAVSDGISPAKVSVADVMLKPPPSVEEGSRIDQVSSALANAGVRRILVRDGTNVIGLIEAGQLFDFVSSSQRNIEVFKAISVRTRLRMAELLSIQSMSVADLSRELGMKPITVRHHLDVLRRSGMVEQFQDELLGKVGRPLFLFKVAGSIMKKSKLQY